MKDFKDCLEGYFDNKYQAMKDPSRYAHIKISHVRLSDDTFYGEQAYSHQIQQPYRQFVLKISQQKNEYIVQNYSIDKPERFVNHKNLEILSEIINCLKKIEDGQCDQQEASFEVGSLLKKMYGKSMIGEAMQESIDELIRNHFENSGDKPAQQPDIQMVNKDWKEGDDVKVTLNSVSYTHLTLPTNREV